MIKKLLYCWILIYTNVMFCQGQSYTLEYSGSAKTLQLVERFQPAKQEVTDSLAATRQIAALLNNLYGTGFISATIKATYLANGIAVALDPGKQYNWVYFSAGNLPELILSKSGFRERIFMAEPFSYEKLAKFFKVIIKESEDTGYPFASIGIDSVKFSGSSVFGVLNYSSGPLITYDSITIEGTSKVKASWLSSFLNLRYGMPFDQSAVDKIDQRIRSLSFLELTAPVQLTFQNSQATILLNLSTSKTNNVDGIIGFSPNGKDDGKLMVTGQFDLDLRNLFASGKSLHVSWQRLKPLSQFLHIAYDHLNLLRTPLHLKGAYELLKQDTSFLNRDALLAFNYQQPGYAFSFFTQMKTSRLLSSYSSEAHDDLPDLNDFNLNYYGLGYNFERYNNSHAYKSGVGAQIEVAVGVKKIKKNRVLAPVVYEDVDLHSIQYQIKGLYQYFVPISPSLVIHQRIAGGKIINDRLFKNDLFRLGGLNSLRGFNEHHFFASDYVLSNLELQLHYDLDSYAFVFYDQSWIYFDTGANELEDYPLGLGAGINFATAGGVVSLAYAVGKSEEQKLDLRVSKFHFGYVAKF